MNHDQQKTAWDAYTLTGIGVMAALVCVITFLRIPIMDSKTNFANALCLLSGLLLGPVPGGLAAGLGSAIFDLIGGGYGPPDILITFASKFAMAWICGLIARSGSGVKAPAGRLYMAVIIGAVSYVALYMTKSLLYALYVNVIPRETLEAKMLSKFIPSALNAAVAIIATPIIYQAVWTPVHQLLHGSRRKGAA